jgi:hypothetical protein
MKKIVFFTVVVGLLLISCSGEDEGNREQPKELIKLGISSISVGYESGRHDVGVMTDLPWEASTSVDWISISPASGTGNGKVLVSWKENQSWEDRKATINFSVKGKQVSMTVTQGHKHEASHIVSYRAVFGNWLKNEKDSVEIIFDKPTRMLYNDSGSKMYDGGLRWQVQGEIAGKDAEVTLHFMSVIDSIRSKETLTVPFYEKKFLLPEQDDAIRFSILSPDKKNLWLSVTNKQADLYRVIQVSLDDMTVTKTIKMPFDPRFLCINPYNGLLYVLPHSANQWSCYDYFCVADPAQGQIVKTIHIEPSPVAHPQYPEVCPDEIAFTKDGFGILLLKAAGTTGLEWRTIDSANDDKMTWSGYNWDVHNIEHLYANYDYSRIYANMYPRVCTTIEWYNREHPTPVEISIHNKFNSDEYYAGGNLMELAMSPFANKAFICTAPACHVVVGLDQPVSYSKVYIGETRGTESAWDELVQDRDYVYKICTLQDYPYLELYDMTKSDLIYAIPHEFLYYYNLLVDCHFLPATDQLAVTTLQGIWLFNAADFKNKAK